MAEALSSHFLVGEDDSGQDQLRDASGFEFPAIIFAADGIGRAGPMFGAWSYHLFPAGWPWKPPGFR